MEMLFALLITMVMVVMPTTIIINTIKADRELTDIYVTDKVKVLDNLSQMTRIDNTAVYNKIYNSIPTALIKIIQDKLDYKALERRQSEFLRNMYENERLDAAIEFRIAKMEKFKDDLRIAREKEVANIVAQFMAYAGDFEIALAKREPLWNTQEFHLDI